MGNPIDHQLHLYGTQFRGQGQDVEHLLDRPALDVSVALGVVEQALDLRLGAPDPPISEGVFGQRTDPGPGTLAPVLDGSQRDFQGGSIRRPK